MLLQLVAEGKIGLDDPVSKYLDFVPNGQNITLRMLANMTAGLFNYTELSSFDDVVGTDTRTELDAARVGRLRTRRETVLRSR